MYPCHVVPLGRDLGPVTPGKGPGTNHWGTSSKGRGTSGWKYYEMEMPPPPNLNRHTPVKIVVSGMRYFLWVQPISLPYRGTIICLFIEKRQFIGIASYGNYSLAWIEELIPVLIVSEQKSIPVTSYLAANAFFATLIITHFLATAAI